MGHEGNPMFNSLNTVHSEEIFFIPSSDTEDEEEAYFPLAEFRQTQGGMEAGNAPRNKISKYESLSVGDDLGVNTSDASSSSSFYSPTVDDVLFGYPDRHGREETAKENSFLRTNSIVRDEYPNVQPPLSPEKNAYPHPEDFRWYAGGSPIAMPKSQTPLPLPPLSLKELLVMTSAEVRNRLEPFFIRKENHFRLFRDTKREGSLGSDDEDEKFAPQGKEDPGLVTEKMWWRRRRRDRRARLVNISNWSNDGVRDSNEDILLPATLVPGSSYYRYRPALLPRRPHPSGVSPHEETCEDPLQSRESEIPPPRTLREHQIDGIRFMWSILVEGPVGQVPAVGCILAHTMGLGKTAQVVVFTHLFTAFLRGEASNTRGMTAKRARDKEHVGSSRINPRILIVAPKSTLPGWLKEFTSWSSYFPSERRLSPMFIDSSSSQLPQRLRTFHDWRHKGGVLLIGYEALSRIVEVVGEERLISKDYPYTELMVCDEAHRLKSSQLKVTSALSSLHPLRRLLLTGTPLQNHLEEYWAMVNFAMPRYLGRQHFKNYFAHPIESSVDHTASEREVDLARKALLILANKTKPFIQRVDCTPLKEELPPLHEYVVVVPMTDLQRELYQRFLQVVLKDANSEFRLLPAVSLSGKISAHPQLAFDQFKKEECLRAERRDRTREAWREADTAAPQALNKRRRRPHIQRRAPFADGDEPYNDDDDLFDAENDVERLHRSSTTPHPPLSYALLCKPLPGYVPQLEDGRKMHVALCIILETMRLGEKCVLFSHSTRLLDLFEVFIGQVNAGAEILPARGGEGEGAVAGAGRAALPRRPIRYARLDGTHPTAQRDALLTAFNDADDVSDLFLMSTKAGGVGVRLTAATRVILLDGGFNPSDDRQAIGRVYRYGQTRPVRVYRLLSAPSLEVAVFGQKLAKEWLFRTVVEAASVRRDGLRGMRLRGVRTRLARTARALRAGRGGAGPFSASAGEPPSGGPPSGEPPSEGLRPSQGALADPVLDAIRPLLAQVRPYATFLRQDAAPRREDGLDDTNPRRPREEAEEEEEEEGGGERRIRTRTRTGATKGVVPLPDRSFVSLVDDIVRSRVGTDSHLKGLLHAMGLRVDSTTGTVQKVNAEMESGFQVGGNPLERDTRMRERNRLPDGSSEQRGNGVVCLRGIQLGLDNTPAEVVSPQRPNQSVKSQSPSQGVLSLSSTFEEEEETDIHVLRDNEPRDTRNQEVNIFGSSSFVNQRHQNLVTRRRRLRGIDPSMYASFRPGSTPHLAIDIDDT